MNTKLFFGIYFSEDTNFLARKFARFRAVALKSLFKTYASTSFVLLFLIVTPLFVHAAPIVPCGIDTSDWAARHIPTTYQFGGVTHSYNEECTFQHFLIGINNVINFLIEIGGSVAAIVFAIAGFRILTAGGNESKMEKGREMFMQVVWGFIWMLSAWLIVKMVLVGLGVPDSFSFLGS